MYHSLATTPLIDGRQLFKGNKLAVLRYLIIFYGFCLFIFINIFCFIFITFQKNA